MADFGKVITRITENKWQFAKSMADIPHFYTVRKWWDVDSHFTDFVETIRKYGYEEQFYSKTFVYLNVNGWKYWTMGEAINTPEGKHWTTIINRAKIDYKGNYDKIADKYDERYENPENEKEDKYCFGMIRPEGRILDVGCGTGLMLKYIDLSKVSKYVGIDPSKGMLDVLESKFKDPKVSVINSNVRDFYAEFRFQGIYSMFGSASYLKVRDLEKMLHYLAVGGSMVLMFLQEGYKTPYHKEINDSINIYLNESHGTPYKHYIIVTENEIEALIETLKK